MFEVDFVLLDWVMYMLLIILERFDLVKIDVVVVKFLVIDCEEFFFNMFWVEFVCCFVQLVFSDVVKILFMKSGSQQECVVIVVFGDHFLDCMLEGIFY